LVDPNACATRGAPSSERDLMIAAENGWICAFDNLSHITPELSDALCRLSTGGGFGVRKHYEDTEEPCSIVHARCHNGIEDVGTRSDLMDRSLIVELPRLTDEARMPEKVFDRKFEEARPAIFGALLTAVALPSRTFPPLNNPIPRGPNGRFCSMGRGRRNGARFATRRFLGSLSAQPGGRKPDRP